jgi:filamentous hemagglutinin family protein
MYRFSQFVFGLVFSGYLSGITTPTSAQIQPDNTLGVESSTVNPGSMNGMSVDFIQGGAQRGVNLFHSFLNFNVAEGQRAYFANPLGVMNILTRVTGNNPSNIMGLLGVDGRANLFLLNPNGILFGANSRLDIRGSFTATTANSFTFSDGSQFSALQPGGAPLLSVNITPGLQYGTTISNINNSGQLEVGQNLTLAGGNIINTGQLIASENLTLTAQNLVQIRDSGTTPAIAQARNTLLIQANQGIDIFALSHPQSRLSSGGDTILRASVPVIGDARYWVGGNFRVEQLDQQLGSLVSPSDPIIRASGDVTLAGYIGASLHILAGGKVTITGGITITGSGPVTDTLRETITLSDGSQLNIDGSSVPTLDIRAGMLNVGTPGVTNTSGFLSSPIGSLAPANLVLPATGSDIFVGNINIAVPNSIVLLTNKYAPNQALSDGTITIQATNFTPSPGVRLESTTGNGGSLTVDSRDNIVLNTSINTSSITGAAGEVKLLAKNNIFSDAQIDTRSSAGNAGQVNLKAGENIVINQSIRTDVRFGSTGNSGNLSVDAPQITIQNGAQLSANTFGSGSGGNIQINAQQLTLQNNAQIASVTGDDQRNNPAAPTNTGQGGNIAIAANSINLQNQSFIFAQANQLSSGNAGNLSITANQLNLQNGSLISGATLGQGRGSTMRLEIADTLTLTGTDTANTQTGIFLNSFNSGNAGSLEILNAQRVLVQSGALISASASSTGQAGSIRINTPTGIVQVTGASTQTASSILSETQDSGRGGDIVVNARQLLLQDGGQISAQTIATGEAGTLTVNASEQVRIFGTNGRFNSRLALNSTNVGRAGGVQISTNQLTVEDGGQIIVNGTGAGVSGNINIVADAIALRSNARIQAKTSLSEGGNIFLRLSNPRISIWMENNSEISAEAFGFANAGNLTIDARGAIISRSLADNNDIVANAVLGRGGRIGATASLILGFRQFQGQRTADSDFTSLSANPVFPGELLLNTEQSPNTQTLPENLANEQLQQVCQPTTLSSNRSEFVVRGAGGIAYRPSDPMSRAAIAVDLVAPVTTSAPVEAQSASVPVAESEIVEAQQIIRLPDGAIALVGSSPPSLPSLNCQSR